MNLRVLALQRETLFTNTIASDAQPVLRGISICRPARRRLPVARPRRLCVRYSGVCLKPPAFQFYPDDFIGGTVDLTAEQCGGYIRLLCYQWGVGKIPSTKEAQDRVAGCAVCDAVLGKFPNGKNRRLEAERRKQAQYRAKQSLKGQASAKARFNRGSTVVQPRVVDVRLEPEGNSPSPSPSPSPLLSTESVCDGGLPLVTMEVFNRMKKELMAEFKRSDSEWNMSDDASMSPVSRRPAALAEMKEIITYRREKGRYAVQDLRRLLDNWQENLDKARTHKTYGNDQQNNRGRNQPIEPVKGSTPVNGF